MGLLYDRKIELNLYFSGTMTTVKDLHVSFSVTVTQDKEPNQATITIYNLSPTTRAQMSAGLLGVELIAGYGNDASMIFKGSWDPLVSSVIHTRTGADWETTIETGEGLKEYTGSFFDRTYPAGTLIQRIVKDVAGSLGLPIINDYLGTEAIAYARTYSGRSVDILTDVLKGLGLGFIWSIQNGTLEIRPEGVPLRKNAEAVLLTPRTGLIGPAVLTETGIEVECFLNPAIRPGKLIKVEGPIKTPAGVIAALQKLGAPPPASGVYRVVSATYSGDNFGADFSTRAEGVSYAP